MCSATTGAVRPGWLETTMPSRRASSRSIMSVPMEQVAIILRSGRASSSAARQLTAPRELMMTWKPRARSTWSALPAGRVSWTVTSP